MNVAELNPVEKHFLDRSFQSNFTLWSALLTVNGIVLSGFGLLRIVTPTVNPIVVSLLVGSSAVSILLIVLNFFVTRELYLEIGRRLRGKAEEAEDLSDEERTKGLRVAGRKHRNTRRRERLLSSCCSWKSASLSFSLCSQAAHGEPAGFRLQPPGADCGPARAQVRVIHPIARPSTG